MMSVPRAHLIPDAANAQHVHSEDEAIFDVSVSCGAAFRRTRQRFGNVDKAFPWQSLDVDRFDSLEIVERARLGWTENALNEYVTASALAQLVQSMVKAQVPIDFIALAGSFIEEEVLHVELCSRVASQLGGGAPIAYRPSEVVQAVDVSQPLRHQVEEQVISLLCVGETLSLPLLAGCMRASSHPLIQLVLKRIVQDEADHGRLGWDYLEWAQTDFNDDDRRRLAQVAIRTLDEHAPVWTRLRSKMRNGVSSEGHLLDSINAMGWMDSETYIAVAQNAVEQLVISRLAKFDIHITSH